MASTCIMVEVKFSYNPSGILYLQKANILHFMGNGYTFKGSNFFKHIFVSLANRDLMGQPITNVMKGII